MTPQTIDVSNANVGPDRYAEIEAARAAAPHAVTPQGAPVFLNQPEVTEVLACQDFRFAFNLIDAERSPYLARAIEHELLNMHGTEHARLSRLLKMALRDRVFEGMQARVDQIVTDLADALPAQGNFCAQFADPLPARVLGPMFGVPYDDVDGLSDWIKVGGRKSDALQSGVGLAEVEEANRKIHDYLRGLLAQRREAPGEDLFSELMATEIDGDRMSDDELVYLTSELASAGVDTTRAQLPLILLALVQHPAEMAKLRANPGLALRAVDEGMRFAPLPWALPHSATAEITLGGATLQKGDLAFVLVPAANRDPAIVPEPNRFNITRDRVRNFAFGAGMHGCPGAQLARMEMASALRQLVARFERIDLDGDPVWEPGFEGRTLKALPLRLVA